MLASIALIQGAVSLGQTDFGRQNITREAFFRDSAHYRHALSRFPSEARFALAEVMHRQEIRRLPHQPFSSPHALVTGLTAGPAWMEKIETVILDDAIEQLTTIAGNQTTRTEVTLRRGIVRFGRGDVTGALDDVRAALEIDPKSDPAVTHVAHLYVGLALDELGRRSEAVASYSAALLVVPRAKSASVALASDFFLLGRRDEAAAVLESANQSAATEDPWHLFSAGDYRFWPRYLGQLRGALQQ
jgi:tetratricopeptide (TPR) repeat protein